MRYAIIQSSELGDDWTAEAHLPPALPPPPTLDQLQRCVRKLQKLDTKRAAVQQERDQLIVALTATHGAPTIGKVVGVTATQIYKIRDAAARTQDQ